MTMKPTPTLNLVKLLLADKARHSFGSLLDKTGITPQYMSKVLDSLVTDGTIKTERTATTTFYWLTPTL